LYQTEIFGLIGYRKLNKRPDSNRNALNHKVKLEINRCSQLLKTKEVKLKINRAAVIYYAS